jgi:hypothetical protein
MNELESMDLKARAAVRAYDAKIYELFRDHPAIAKILVRQIEDFYEFGYQYHSEGLTWSLIREIDEMWRKEHPEDLPENVA